MKKVLTGAAAVAAAAMFSSGYAVAADEATPVSVGVSGYMQQWVSVVDHDMSEYSGTQVKSESEIFFKGSTELDNGLTVGLDIQLEGTYRRNSNQIDEAYMWLSGAFGKFEIGTENGAAYKLMVNPADPGMTYTNDGYMGYWVGAQGFGGVHRSLSGDADKITYYTPRFQGVQLAASYSPDQVEAVYGVQDKNGLMEIVEAALNYSKSFDMASLDMSLGTEQGSSLGTGGMDPAVVTGGIKVSAAGVTVGASFGETTDAGAGNGQSATAGVQYDAGPWAVSMNVYSADKKDDSTATEHLHLQAKYILGPGIDVNGLLGQTTLTSAEGAETDATYAIMGLRVVF